MPGESINQVILADGRVLMNITDTTATPETVTRGAVFYASNGDRSVGAMNIKLDEAAAYPEYNESANYAIGNVCTHDGKIYVCNAPTTGAWDSTKWTEKTISQFLDEKLNASLKGAASGVAELDASGKVPSSQLPGYVDDVIDGYYYNNKFYKESTHQTEIQGETGKVYVDVSTNITYRWSGSAFVPIGSDLALGETSSTAYRGDRGAAAYAAAVTDVDSTPTANSTHLVTSGGVAAAIPDISGKVDKETGKGLSTNDYTDAEKTKLSGIAEGATANVGTITGITMNGASKGTSGVVDLGTVITEHQDISGKMNSSLKGAANGVAELDSAGKVPSSQLPSYVDDVVEGYYYDNKFYEDSAHQTEITGETGKVYVDVSTNITYRWSGSAFVTIGSDLALGETSSTAYRGDRGAAAYAAAVTNVDSTPTASSTHLVTSGGVAAAIPGVMTGATSSTAGAAGTVPSPVAGDNVKVLMGNGEWSIAPGARIYVAETTVTNTSGAYSATVQDENLTSDMIAMRIEMGTPGVFKKGITVSPGSGSYTVSCQSVSGTSTLKIYFAKQQQNPLTITSTEFDILDNRLQVVENVRATVPVTIASTDWTLSNGEYSYTYTNSLLTANCAVDVQLQNGAESAGISGFNVEKGTVGTLVFTTTETPTGNLPVIVEICNAKASDILNLTASDIASEAITGCDTVEEALTELNSKINSLKNGITETTLISNEGQGSQSYTTTDEGLYHLIVICGTSGFAEIDIGTVAIQYVDNPGGRQDNFYHLPSGVTLTVSSTLNGTSKAIVRKVS